MAIISLDEFAEKCNAMCSFFPEKRREGIHECGDIMENAVVSNINALKSHPTGNLLAAVTRKEGSGGGYAIIKNNYAIAHHAWLVENGHWTGNEKWPEQGKYVPKLGVRLKRGIWVSGKHMYYNAGQETRDTCIGIMEKKVGEAVDGTFGK